MGELTDLHESLRVGTDDARPAWSVDDAPDDFVVRQLRAIVGVSISVGRVEAKRKQSQNRSDDDRTGVVDGLGRVGGPQAERLRAAMRETGSVPAD